MCKLLLCLSWLGMLGAAALYAGQANRLVREVSPASVRGRVTIFETINRTATTNPVRDLQVFLFTPEASKPFEELQHKCRRAMAHPNADPVQTYQLCERDENVPWSKLCATRPHSPASTVMGRKFWTSLEGRGSDHGQQTKVNEKAG
jgi:hypothetical protein